MRSRVSSGRTGLFSGIPAASGILVFTTTVSHTFGRSTYGVLIPAIEEDFGISHARAGAGSTVIFAAYLFGLLLVAWISPKVEPINIMRGGLACGFIGLTALGFAPSFELSLVGLAFAAGSGAGIWITAPLLATDGVPVNRRGFVIGMLSGTIGLGSFVVGVGTGLLRSSSGNEQLWRPIWIGEAAFTLLLLLATLFLVHPAKTEKLGGGFSLSRLKAVEGWKAITAGYAVFGVVVAGLQPFLVVALEEDAGLTRTQASTAWAVMGLGGIVSAPAIGLLSDRVGRRSLIVTIMLLIGVGCLILAFGTGLPVAGGVMIFGSTWGALPAMVASQMRDQLDAREFSTVFATMTVVYSVCAIGSGPAVGYIADQTGSFRWSFVMLAAFALLASFAFSRLPHDRPSQNPLAT